MMAWIYLAAAILTEVSAALALKAAANGKNAWYAVVAAGYLAAFTALTFALAEGLGIGVAYGIWVAVGVALTAIGSRVFFKEPLTWVMGAGMALIGTGVLLIEMGAH